MTNQTSLQQRKRHHRWWWILAALPAVAAFIVQWLPALNGPHLFLGIPSILWWTCVPGSLLVTVVLIVIEGTRSDDAREAELDDDAIQGSSEREADL